MDLAPAGKRIPDAGHHDVRLLVEDLGMCAFFDYRDETA
jgi:hypothetical protein